MKQALSLVVQGLCCVVFFKLLEDLYEACVDGRVRLGLLADPTDELDCIIVGLFFFMMRNLAFWR